MLLFIQRLLRDESGQGMVEYGLILALVAVVVIVALTAMGTQISALFNDLADTIGDLVGGGGDAGDS